MAKYTEIAAMMQRRIVNGDYAFARIPGARKLAEETGVSYMTARQAVQKLLDDGVISRAVNGRFEAQPVSSPQAGLKIAFIGPIRFHNYFLWENAIKTAAEEAGGSFRMVVFSHDDDPVIGEVLNGDFDLVFLAYNLANRFIINQIRKNCGKVVTLFRDMTADGVRCLDGPSPSETANMVEHLYRRGHRRADAFSVFSSSASSMEKIKCWHDALKARGMTGNTHQIELAPFEYSLHPSYSFFRRLLDSGEFRATAVFAPVMENAIGIIRACHDRGLVPGRDISVCSFGQPEMAAMHIPSITVIDRPDPTSQVRDIIREFLEDGPDRPRRLMFRPAEGKVIEGESTGPAPGKIVWLNS